MTDIGISSPRSQVDTDRGSTFAAELAKDQQSRARSRSLKPLRRLVPFILRYPGTLAAFVLFLALASAFTLALPAAFRMVVDCGFAAAPETAFCATFETGNGLGGYFMLGMGVAIGLGVASALRFYFVARLGERVVADLRSAVYDHILNLSPEFYARTRTGEVLSRLTTDTTLIQTLVGSSISIAVRTLATTSGAIVLMLLVNWKLSLMVLSIGAMVLLPMALFGRRVQRLSRSSQDNLAEASGRASEALRAIETVQAFTREDEERAQFTGAVESTFQMSMRRVRVRAAMTAIIFSSILAGLIGALWWGAVQVQSGSVTPGAMTQFVMYSIVAVSGFGVLTETFAEVMRAAGATERLMELLAARPTIEAPAQPVSLTRPVRGAIGFKSVSFAYPARPDRRALEAVDLVAEPGQTIALVGPSGAGKSTVFQLLLRLYDPQEGSVTLDGEDIRKFDPADLREELAIVQQNAPLFSGTAADNIRFGRRDASAADVRAAASAANAHDFISALPQGYDTPLGEGATTLSGGQRQRIAIARAILRDTPVLLLDEATSALDSESEHAIQAAFETLSNDRTTIVIAHRLATVLKADKIYVMDEGRIVDQGSHADLLARGGLYARLVELQFGTPLESFVRGNGT